MRLRQLEKKDASFMLEWMHDESVVENLQANFKEKTLSDCERFIELAQNDENNVHMAIVDDDDIYMGTVSLKNIYKNTAEFAITIRVCAMGRGYSKFGMREVLNIAINDLKLDYVYWYVSKKNSRAISFYNKNEYKQMNTKETVSLSKILLADADTDKYIWYIFKKKGKIYEL